MGDSKTIVARGFWVRQSHFSDGLLALLFSVAGALHLLLGGMLPSGMRWIGDGFLALLVLSAVALRRFVASDSHRELYWVGLLSIALTFALLIYTAALWGPDLDQVRWARRWLVGGAYLMVLGSRIPSAYGARFVRWTVWSLALVTLMIVLGVATGSGQVETIRNVTQTQGGVAVLKVFAPGVALVMMLLIYNQSVAMVAPTIRGIGAFTVGLLLAAMIVRYRGYWIAYGIVSLVVVVGLVGFRRRLRPLLRSRLAAGLLIAATGAAAWALVPDRIGQAAVRVSDWLESAFTELASSAGNIAFRIEADWSRVARLHESNLWHWKLLGVGFVPTNSYASAELGFTSETNDTGVVEILVTSGWVGAVVIGVLVLVILRLFFAWFRAYRKAGYLGVLACVAFATMTMFSSNMLLWDFGFVPLAFYAWLALCSDGGCGPSLARSDISRRVRLSHPQQQKGSVLRINGTR